MSASPRVEIVGPDRRDEAVEVLCAAFLDSPLFRYALQDAGETYPRGLATLIGHFTDRRFRRGFGVLGIRSGSRLVATANVNPAKPPPAPTDASERWAALADVIGPAALKRFEAFGAACESLAPGGSFLSLSMIGVRPEHQGEGLGGAILRHLADESEKEERPIRSDCAPQSLTDATR